MGRGTKRRSKHLHDAARPPHTRGTIRVNATMALFEMEPTSEPAPVGYPALRVPGRRPVVTMLGNAVAPIALAFAVLDLTGSVRDLGLVVGARSAAKWCSCSSAAWSPTACAGGSDGRLQRAGWADPGRRAAMVLTGTATVAA